MDNDKYLWLLNHRLKENDDWYQQAGKLLGMSDSTFWILYMLYDYSDGITQSEICSMSCFPKQTINSSLKKLEADGKELISRTIVKVRHAEYAALNGMTDEEKEALISALDKFTRLLNEATHIIRE